MVDSVDSASNNEFPTIMQIPNADIDEDEKFAEQGTLFRFSRERNEWNERGFGIIKILEDKETGFQRILMRQNQTYKVRVNHQIPYLGKLHTLEGSDREFSWTAFDFSDTNEQDNREMFAVRFDFPTIAEKFKDAFQEGQLCNKRIMESQKDDM